MANNVLAIVEQIIGNPTQAACSGHVLPEGGGNPVQFEAFWTYGSTLNQIQVSIVDAIKVAMLAVNLPIGINDKIALFCGPTIL